MQLTWPIRHRRFPVVFSCLIGAILCHAAARADQWFELDGKALSTFEIEGSTLPTTIKQLKDRFPAAEIEPERVDQSVGLTCYLVKNLPSVDAARFYFCDGNLYQFEAQYNLDRVEKLGGTRSVVQKLVDTWGPVDHAGERRWTWMRNMYSRRADFYAWPEFAKLTITDTSWMPIVNRRILQAEAKQPMNLGFESR